MLCAGEMYKTHMNMSKQEMDESTNEMIKEGTASRAKSADNKHNESTFGWVGYLKQRAEALTHLRIEGVVMYKTNAVGKWLRQLPDKVRNEILLKCSKRTNTREAIRAGHDKVAEIKQYRHNQQRMREEQVKQRDMARQARLKLPQDMKELWTSTTLHATLDELVPQDSAAWKGKRHRLIDAVYNHMQSIITCAHDDLKQRVQMPRRSKNNYNDRVQEMHTILCSPSIMDAYTSGLSNVRTGAGCANNSTSKVSDMLTSAHHQLCLGRGVSLNMVSQTNKRTLKDAQHSSNPSRSKKRRFELASASQQAQP